MVRRFAAGVAAGTAFVVSLTGCVGGGKSAGGGTGSGRAIQLTAAQVISKVSQKTSQIRSFNATMTEDGTYSGHSMSMRATVKTQLKPHPLMGMDFTQLQVGGRSVGDGIQEILAGDAVYMKMPALSQMTGGKPWIKMTFSQLKQQSGVDVQSMLNQSQEADPITKVRKLATSKDAHKVGTETIDGVQTTHFRGTYSSQDELAKLSAQQRRALQKAFGRQGTDRTTFDLWVDGQDLPRKLAVTTPAGSPMQMNIVVNYGDFNTPVTITVPPADEVTDGSRLFHNPSASGIPS